MKYKLVNSISFFFLFLGVFIVYSIGANTGWNKILEKIFSIQAWQIATLFLLPLTWYTLHVFAWYYLLNHKKTFSLRMIFRAHVASSAVSEVLPMGQAGGESYRVYFLKKKYEKENPENSSNIFASVVLYNTIHTFSTGIFFACAFLIVIAMIPLGATQKIIIITAIILIFAGLIFIISRQRNGFMVKVLLYLKRFKIFQPFVERKIHKAELVDQRLNQFYTENKKQFYFSSFLLFISKFIGVLEIFLIMSFIGDSISFEFSAFVFAGKAFSQILFFFFPGQVGASEGSIFYLFNLLGLNPVSGITTALFIRIRTIAWTFMGLMIVFFLGPKLFNFRRKTH